MPTRERSPNYPGFGLEAAVQMLQALYGSEHRSPVPVEVAARALGHAGVSEKGRLSGPALAKLAALRQYGLIENTAKGKVKVADSALDFVVHGPTEPEYLKAAQVAALAPPLFSDLFKEYAKASDNAIRAHLIKERKFSEDGANRLIRAFRDTISFAKLGASSYTPSDDGEIESPSKANAGFGEFLDPLFPRGSAPRRQEGAGPTNMSLTYILPGGVNAQLTFAGAEPNRKAILRLIDYLMILKDDLQESGGSPDGA